MAVLADEFIYYEVQKGDTLSSILLKFDIGPIYGESGFQKISANINNLPLHGDKIKVGEILRFPAVNKSIENSPAPVPLSESSPESESEFKSEPVQDLSQYHHLSISPQVSRLDFTSDSDDIYQRSRLKTFSKPVPALNLGYELHWDEKYKILAFTQLSRVSLYPDDVVVFKKQNFSRNNYGLGLGFKRPRSSTEIRAGYFDEVFFNFTSSTNIAIDVVSMPEVQFLHFQTIAERKKMNLQLGLNAKAILPAQTASVQSRAGYGAGMQFLIGTKTQKLIFFYSLSQAKSKANQTTVSEIGLGYVIEKDFHD